MQPLHTCPPYTVVNPDLSVADLEWQPALKCLCNLPTVVLTTIGQ